MSMFRRLAIAGFMLFPSATAYMKGEQQQAKSFARHAICILYPNQSKVYGSVAFSQGSITQPTKIAATVKGLKPDSSHGIHIHEFGDLTQGCHTAGPHYNPTGKKHGDLDDAESHVGDLGNIRSDSKGVGFLCVKTSKISLFGEHSIVGRSVVVHSGEDDLGKGGNEESLKTGNSGERVACGVIALASEFKSIAP